MDQASVEDLLHQTRDPDPRVRRRAARELCPCAVKRDDVEVWERLFELGADEDAGVRRSVFHTLVDGSPRARQAQVLVVIDRMRMDPDAGLRRQVRKRLAKFRRTGIINLQGH